MSTPRPEIQALRAIAVGLVVVHHLWPAALPGGFVGVDVFFAISGFLITSLLLRELERSGSVSLKAFWIRRARRILPAALLVLLVSLLATIALVPMSYWEQYLADVRASTVYVQNWHLADAAVDYFSAEDEPSPVQHYWSLAVEEQFYLLWPVLLLVAAKLRRRAALAVAMGLVTALSLVYSLKLTATDPATAYFVTPTRMWELGAGGLLAVALAGRDGSAHPSARALVSWAGLAAIAVASAAYTTATPFPGHAALLPVLGTLAVITAGAPGRLWAPTPLLTPAPVQLLGDISYSVYLWHWPLVVLAPFALGGRNPSSMVVILMLTLLLAWLTKLLVEDPMRFGFRRRGGPPRPALALVAAASAAVLSLSAAGDSHVRDEIRKAERVSQQVIDSRPRCFGAASREPRRKCVNPRLRLSVVPTPLQAADRPNSPCTIQGSRGLVNPCHFGTSRREATGHIALIGDSHASHWRAAVDVVARARGWHGVSLAHSGCPLNTATKVFRRHEDSVDCRRWNQQVVEWLRDHPEISTVFVSGITGSDWVASRGRSEFDTVVPGFTRAWRALPRNVKKVIVIRDTPRTETETAACVERAMAARRPPGQACATRRSWALPADPAAVAASRMSRRRAGVADMTRFMCDRGRCYPVIGGALVYKDQHHLTSVYATTLGPYLLRKVNRLVPIEP